VPRLSQQLNAALQQVDQLTAQVRDLQTRVETKPTEPPPKPAANPKDVENFGAEMIEMVQRYAGQVFDAMATQYQQIAVNLEQRIVQLEQVVSGVSQRTEMTGEQLFFADLQRRVPDWETINVAPAFLAWLAEVDPVYRVPRKAALDRAYNALDSEGVAAVFNAFKATQAPAPTPSAPGGSLESQVAPSTAGSAPPAPNPQPFVVTQQLINKFYRDQERGAYRGREAEAQRLEAEINRAVAEGRVR
jgi:hypothetical protein